MCKVEFDSYDSYRDYFEDLVELERKEEMKKHKDEIKELSAKERQNKGRALLGLKFNEEKKGLRGSVILKFSRNYEFPDNEISVGDLIRVSKNEPLNPENPTGTVTEITSYSISVSFDQKPPSFVYGKGVRIDLFVNDITFQRMLDALDELESSRFKKHFLYGKKPVNISKKDISQYYNKKLNESQKKAVRDSVSYEDVFLIHGPPGTGKTTTLVEVIEQHIENGCSVLATADSNVAVDNLVEFLSIRGREVVRVGHPARVSEKLKKKTLDYLVEKTEEYKKSQKIWNKISELNKEQEKYTYPSGRWKRGLSNEAIKDLARKGKGSRGVPPEKIKSMAKWLNIQEEINKKVDEAKELESNAIERILEESEVICTTNSTSGSELLEKKEFDLVAIDEATQATEPSCLIPITKANKIIMAGDHKQLPPTILNHEAKESGLRQTLFERLLKLYGDKIKDMLRTQYRMNKKIMEFPSKEFYDGELKADESVANHDVSELISGAEIIDESPLVFYDTHGSYREQSREGSTSKENRGEANLVNKLVNRYIELGIEPNNIGVITPYDDQVDLLKQKITSKEIEINSVDGFQGREKEIIILSFVRSNRSNELGFLTDYRRLNVSITRARRKLVLIGDSKTLATDNVYRMFFDYLRKNGVVKKV